MKYHPSLQLILTFFLLIILGFLLLYNFGFTATDSPHKTLNALFSATSAVCVTGLTVIDLSTDLTFTGQVTILFLIQLGGLGMLTLSNWILLTIKGHLNVGQTEATTETFGVLHNRSIAYILKHVITFTLVVEGVGTLLLFFALLDEMPVSEAFWFALFHAVSAFCNAGFTLFPDSLTAYQDNYAVMGIIVLLILLGGIGFLAAYDITEVLQSWLQGVRKKLALQTKMVLLVNGILIGGGFLAFLVFEFNNSLANGSFLHSIANAFFLSVTSRTAGFNTLETMQLTNMSLVVLIFLMIIGASPGSTGGGIKVSTIAVFWAFLSSKLLNREQTVLFQTAIPYKTVSRSILIILFYLLTAFIAIGFLQLTEVGNVPHSETREFFLEHLFEVISALSTVGLTIAQTTDLSPSGQMVIIACMFIGRIGPLVIVSTFIGERKSVDYDYPEENIMVG